MLPDRYIPRKISEIDKNDKKVSVVGKIIEKKEDSFVLESDGEEIEILFEKENSGGPDMISSGKSKIRNLRDKIKKEKPVRAFCSVIGEHLKLDVVQDITGLDLNLLKTVDDLYSKAGV